MKILISEDNEDSRLILRKTLESEGHAVSEATNGAEALKTARKSPPDMIISDILMPQMDGFMLCRAFKADTGLRKIPFVFYTATYTDPKDERLAMSLGASRFIKKPLENRPFLKIIDEVIQEYQEDRLIVPRMPLEEENEILKMYDDSLARKLDKKLKELEIKHRALLDKEAELRESEEKYRRLIETANDAIFVADAETGIIIDANKKAEALIGIPVEKIKGMHQSRLHPAEEAGKYKKIFKNRIKNGSAISEDLYVVHSSRQKIPVEISSKVMKIEGRKIIQGIFRDITERKQAADILKESEGKFRDLVMKSGFGVYIIQDRVFTYCSPRLAEIFGYTVEELVEKSGPEDLVFPDDWPIVKENLQRRFSGEIEFIHYGFRGITKSGDVIYVEVYGSRTVYQGRPAVIGSLLDITERKVVEEALRESEERFRAIFESSPMGISISNPEGVLIHSNRTLQKMLGYSEKELKRSFAEITHPADVEKNLRLFKEMTEDKRKHYRMEKRYLRKDGSIMWANLLVTAVTDRSGKFKYNYAIIEDLSERKKLEDQLRHAQKMEAVGQLAGGVAHDFNNLLTAIIGYGNLIKMKLKDDDPLNHNINQILEISDRGAGLTQGLLAFSRKQVIALKPVSLNSLLMRIVKLLPGLIGEEIEVKTGLADEDLTVIADSGQIEQVIVNLATNARDAMIQGGTLTIATESTVLDRETAFAQGYGDAGKYACVSMSDTGSGMNSEIQEKIFEPFFTTKEVGKGTGLGLAMAYGIIKQHNGYINVQSTFGQGTTIRIYFPMAMGKGEEQGAQDLTPLMGGTETILLAEDEIKVRESLKSILEEFGFTVIEAVDGEDAVKKFEENRDRIQLLILDVIMPRKNGKDAYEEIKRISPEMKALFTSGYTEKAIHARGVLEKGLHFISKPFYPSGILKKIREVLNV